MKLSKKKKMEFAREFFKRICDMQWYDLDDTFYDDLDPECEYGEELCDAFNVDTVKEVIKLGFYEKYGEHLNP